MKLELLRALVVAIAAVAFASPVAAQTHTLSGDADDALVGMANIAGDGTSAKVAVVCWRNTVSGVETLARLRSDTSTGGLNRNIAIDAGAGNDAVWSVTAASYTPPTSVDCVGLAGLRVEPSTTWDPLVTNSFEVTYDGWTGDDNLYGLTGSADMNLWGWTGNDFLYNQSSIGLSTGEDGDDAVLSFTTGGSDQLYGDEGNDCLWDSSNSVSGSGFDCGPHSGAPFDRYHSSNASIQINCEASILCCGGVC